MAANSSGSINVAIGASALASGDGNNNVSIGGDSMNANKTGSGNVAIGVDAGYDSGNAPSWYDDDLVLIGNLRLAIHSSLIKYSLNQCRCYRQPCNCCGEQCRSDR